MHVLVDTSVWSLAFRRRAEHLNPTEQRIAVELAELIVEGRRELIGIVRQELLSGIRFANQFEKLRNRLRAFPDEPLAVQDYELAARASNRCRTAGISGTVTDFLLCAISSSRGWPIFTTDPDFERYAKVLSLQLHLPRNEGATGSPVELP